MFKSNVSTAKIIGELRISARTLRRWLRPYNEEQNQKHQKLKDKVINMYKSGMNATKIAKELKTLQETVSRWLRPYKDQRHQELKNKAIEMFKSNVSTAKIIGELRISARTLRRWLRPYNEEQNQKHQKLKDKVINMYKSGMNATKIAKELKTPQETVSRWLRPYKKEHGIIQPQQSHSQELKDRAINMVIKNGMTEIEAAQNLKISRSTLGHWIRKYKKEKDLEIRKKEHYSPDVKDLVVGVVIEDGISIEEVAEEWNIPENTILHWVKNHKRKHKEKLKRESQGLTHL